MRTSTEIAREANKYAWSSKPEDLKRYYELERELIEAMKREEGEPEPTCKRCKKTPEQIAEYKYNPDGVTATEFVRENERFIPGTNQFYCTDCYIKAGMPLF